MVMRQRSFLLALAAVAWMAPVSAQSVAPPLVVQSPAPEPPPIDLSLPPGVASFELGSLAARGLFQPGTTPEQGGLGPTWQASAAAAFRAPGGFRVSASIVGRRGYQMPLFMAGAAGSDTVLASPAIPLATTWRVPVLWDTRLRVERRIKAGRRLQIDAIAEAFNLVNANPSPAAANVSGTLTSRTFRVGLVLGF